MAQKYEKKDVENQLAQFRSCATEAQSVIDFVAFPTAWTPEAAQTLKENQKVVHFVRHGEGYHNRAQREWRNKPDYDGKSEPYSYDLDPDFKFIDPSLTEIGIKEAQDLDKVTSELTVDLIVTSP